MKMSCLTRSMCMFSYREAYNEGFHHLIVIDRIIGPETAIVFGHCI